MATPDRSFSPLVPAGLARSFIATVQANLAGSQSGSSEYAQRYWGDPAGWMRECVRWKAGQGPTDYQLEAADALWEYKRLAQRAPRGAGKTSWNALILLWFATTRDAAGVDWKVVTTAAVWAQLSRYLWPEVHLWAQRLRPDVMGRPLFSRTELLLMSLNLRHGSAFGYTSDRPENLEGAHAEHLLWLFDEAKAIGDEMFDSAEGSLSAGDLPGGETLAIATSTPGRRRGRFWQMFKRAPGLERWHCLKVTVERAVAAGRVSPQWIEDMGRLWGKDSALYHMHVLAEFGSEPTDGLIPLEWVEAACARWQRWRDAVDAGASPGRVTSVGVDVGMGGEDGDPTALAVVRDGVIVERVDQHSRLAPGTELMDVVTIIQRQCAHEPAPAFIDCIGIGAGVVQRLRQMGGVDAVPFHAGNATGLTDRSGELGFTNWRSAMWWLMREMLDPDAGIGIALPPDDDLIEELVTPRSTVVDRIRDATQHSIQVEAKDQIRRRLKRQRSTNCADAVLQALFGPTLWREAQDAGRSELVYRERRPGEGW